MAWDDTPPDTVGTPTSAGGSWDSMPPDNQGMTGQLPQSNNWLDVINQAIKASAPSSTSLQPIQPTSGNPLMAALQSAGQTLQNPARISPTISQPGQVLANSDIGQAVQTAGSNVGIPPPLSHIGIQAVADPQTYILGNLASNPIQEGLESGAQAAGRKALGFTSKYLKAPGAIQRANQTAQTMLDEGIIQPFSSTEKISSNLQNLLEKSGKAIKQSIDEATASGAKSFSPDEAIKAVKDQLMPKYQGGQYDKISNMVNDVIDTIKAHSPATTPPGTEQGILGITKGGRPITNDLTFESAQDLKQTLQQVGKFNIQADPTRASIFGRASGIVRQMLDDSIENAVKSGFVKPETALNYLANKPIYSMAKGAVNPVTGKLAAEIGNDTLNLKDLTGIIGSMATGHPLLAAGLLGGDVFAPRIQSTMATFLNTLAKSGYSKLAGKLIAGAGQQLNVKGMQQLTSQQ